MSIIFDSQRNTFKLDTAESSYIIKICDGGYLLNLYYGAKIPDTYVAGRESRYPNASFSPVDAEAENFCPDTAPLEYSTNGAGDLRISALSVRNKDGNSVTDIRYEGHKIYNGKLPIEGMPSTYANTDGEAQTLEIYAKDGVTGARVTLYYTVFESYSVMTRRSRIENTSDAPMKLERAMSLSLDLAEMDYDMITLWGAHNMERNVERRPLSHGVQGVESKRGSSSHAQNPFMALAKFGADEEHGEVFGFNLVYSGNHSLLAECDFNSATRVIIGINPTDFIWNLGAGEYFDTPECVMVYSDGGLGEMSRTFHRFYNNNLIRGKYKHEKRPLLINHWEATSFDITTEKLVEFAKEAKELGFEMLVMDDGWFGKRYNSKSSLGDWYVNEEKLSGGLQSLISQVNALGLKFGIWYEPEMISPDSDLYRAHPDWCVHVPVRVPKLGRNQLVLDVSRAEVREYVFGMMKNVLSNHKIDYVKWDFNRNLSDAGSAQLSGDRGGEFFHRFVLGTYDLMNRLTTEFPDILLENCSGGGGRFDPAMLAYSPQIWTSDNSEAIHRLKIQFGTSLCYPASTMGAHVSAKGRTPLKTRGDVALWGTFGYELDPKMFSEEEREIVKAQVADYHKYYELMHTGDLFRLISPFENPYLAAWEIVSEDKSEALITVVTVKQEHHRNLILRPRGLDENKTYKNSFNGQICSGRTLMKAGIAVHATASSDGESLTVNISEAN